MNNRYDPYRSRPSRYGRAERDSQQSDAIVVALTVQILVCVVLLVAFGVLKKVNEPRFDRVRSQYDTMTTDPEQINQLAALLAEWTNSEEGIGAKIGYALEYLIGRITGNPPQVTEDAESSSQEEGHYQSAGGFSYDYLRPTGAAGGVERWLPVGETDNEQMTAPKGSSLNPVYMGGRVLSPVEGIITSLYAYRYHPLTGTSDFHTGIDVAAEEGRNILAALPGEVVEVGWSDIYGNYIVLQHATHLQTTYSHCAEIIAKEGMAVRQGERIAKVGSTGTVTGPHLHFSVLVDETFVDPFWVLGDNLRVVE